ncbi:hypothetical protein HMPREF9095_1532 [Haemophilus aegyptius ATCC 11116]|nr:hypothetical protein HMPREF9095_1532 [Haemophilus aegyptius ATCC 11116]
MNQDVKEILAIPKTVKEIHTQLSHGVMTKDATQKIAKETVVLLHILEK